MKISNHNQTNNVAKQKHHADDLHDHTDNPEKCSTFNNFFQNYALDPIMGHNVPQNYQPKCWLKAPVMEAVRNLHIKIANRQIAQTCEAMPSINLCLTNYQIDQFTRQKDSIYLHGLLTDLLHALIAEKRDQGLTDSEIVVPYNLGQPIWEISNYLGVKTGMCGEFYCNWIINNNGKNGKQGEIEEMKVMDLGRVFHFSQEEDQKDQDLFFGGSVLGSFYLFKSIKLLYLMQEKIQTHPLHIENQCIEILKRVEENLRKINASNLYILDNLTQTFLANKLRKFLRGFQNVNIEGYDKKLTSGGGAGGFDPCFQIFQRFIGIHYQGPLAKTQQIFRTGFSKPINALIFYLEQHSKIRQFCEQTPKIMSYYNRVITEYSNFYLLHRRFLQKFVMDLDSSAKVGVGGVKLTDIQGRCQNIKKQTI